MTQEDDVKRMAREVGFDACGIATSEPFDEEMVVWREWLRRGYNATMEFMERRVNPCDLVEEARSVIVCLMNYYPLVEQADGKPRVARYAYSKDYHYVVWGKLKMLAERLGLEEYVMACDTMPLFDRALAVRAGLGWIGRNNMLINKEFGSYTFIGSLVTTLPLKADGREKNRCGNCCRCLEACPTGALSGHCLNANKCLSYRTIESKTPLSADEARENWVFGCDECQMACPWNKRFAHGHEHPELEAVTLSLDIPSLSNSVLRKGQSPFCRSNITKLKKNYSLCISNRQNS